MGLKRRRVTDPNVGRVAEASDVCEHCSRVGGAHTQTCPRLASQMQALVHRWDFRRKQLRGGATK